MRLIVVAILVSLFSGCGESPVRAPDAKPPVFPPPEAGCCLDGDSEEWCVFYVGHHECYQFECATHVMATCSQ
jgi:uncharacterized protein YceK